MNTHALGLISSTKSKHLQQSASHAWKYVASNNMRTKALSFHAELVGLHGVKTAAYQVRGAVKIFFPTRHLK